MYSTLGFVFVFIAIWFITRFLRSRPPNGLKPLPGPYGLPLLGYMPFLGKHPYKKLTKLSKKYGEIYQLKVGIRTVIVLNSLEVMRKAHLHNLAFAGRPQLPSFRTFAQSGGGSRFGFRPANAQWRFLRRNALRALHLFASSKNAKLEAVVDGATESFDKDIQDHIGVPFDPQQSIFETVAGVIGSVNFGVDFSRKDPLLENVCKLTEAVAKFVQLGSILDFFPFGSWLMKRRTSEFLEAIEPVNKVTENHILAHEYKGNEETVRDVADALFVAAQETSDDMLKSLALTRNHIKFISQDLFGAGFGTIMESFRWSLNLLAIFDEKQRKAQMELDRVMCDTQVTLNDRQHLPYCEAVLLEMLRFVSLVPLGVPHSVMEDTELNGYFIPKNSIVMNNIYCHHNNPQVFPMPESFTPERFVNQDGSLDLDMAQQILSFGVGKRRCVGENLARQELFLLICRTLHKFTISLCDGSSADPFQSNPGVTRVPGRGPLIFTRRKLASPIVTKL